MSDNTLTVGYWIEREPRVERRCPSYYAADYEVLQTIPGRYPLRVTFEGGFDIPMPYWVLAKVDAIRTAGALYSGFGGVNFASTPLPLEPAPLPIQCQVYQLAKLVDAGVVELDPQFAWLARGHAFDQPEAPKTWADVRALKGASDASLQ